MTCLSAYRFTLWAAFHLACGGLTPLNLSVGSNPTQPPSAEVPEQNNVARLGAASKHKIAPIGGKSKFEDKIRFEVG